MSAIAYISSEHQSIRIVARLFLYGSEANPEVLTHILDEINMMWNEPEASINLFGLPLMVRFDIQGVVVEIKDIPMLISNNRDYSNNFIRIEAQNHLERSMMGLGLGDNSGHWLSTDQLGKSTTAAHEFGHALGLPHPSQTDYRGENLPPPIMAPRGTLVDAPYQWNPSAKAGEPGGTMNPRYRRVRESEIRNVFHPFIQSEFTARILLGKLSNTMYDAAGNPLILS